MTSKEEKLHSNIAKYSLLKSHHLFSALANNLPWQFQIVLLLHPKVNLFIVVFGTQSR